MFGQYRSVSGLNSYMIQYMYCKFTVSVCRFSMNHIHCPSASKLDSRLRSDWGAGKNGSATSIQVDSHAESHVEGQLNTIIRVQWPNIMAHLTQFMPPAIVSDYLTVDKVYHVIFTIDTHGVCSCSEHCEITCSSPGLSGSGTYMCMSLHKC